MDFKEQAEKALNDPRVWRVIQEMKKTDTSFTERGFMRMLPHKYTQKEVRDIWFKAIALGMNHGIHMAGLAGQQIDLMNSKKTEKQKEFLDKFFELANEYNCAIMFHPEHGMCICDLQKNDNLY